MSESVRGAVCEGQAVSYLFVPGNRPERFNKAATSGAHRVIIDLEDAVGAEDKVDARARVVEAILGGVASGHAPIIVRINRAGSPWYQNDLEALARAVAKRPRTLAGLMLPRLESPSEVQLVRGHFGERVPEVLGLIESARGLMALNELVGSGLTRLALGGVDLSVDVGCEIGSPFFEVAYAQLVIASRAAGLLPPIASPHLAIHDADALERGARKLASMGVAGQLVIHPAQIEPVHRGFAPTAEEAAWAERVLASVGAATQVDGQMIDRPVRERAERIREAVRRKTH